jgi:hypothetical protein
MEKPLSEITRNEWIKYQWIDVTRMGDPERMMLQGFLRTPDESYQAMMEWEETAEERGVEPEPEEEKGIVQ